MAHKLAADDQDLDAKLSRVRMISAVEVKVGTLVVHEREKTPVELRIIAIRVDESVMSGGLETGQLVYALSGGRLFEALVPLAGGTVPVSYWFANMWDRIGNGFNVEVSNAMTKCSRCFGQDLVDP